MSFLDKHIFSFMYLKVTLLCPLKLILFVLPEFGTFLHMLSSISDSWHKICFKCMYHVHKSRMTLKWGNKLFWHIPLETPYTPQRCVKSGQQYKQVSVLLPWDNDKYLSYRESSNNNERKWLLFLSCFYPLLITYFQDCLTPPDFTLQVSKIWRCVMVTQEILFIYFSDKWQSYNSIPKSHWKAIWYSFSF